MLPASSPAAPARPTRQISSSRTITPTGGRGARSVGFGRPVVSSACRDRLMAREQEPTGHQERQGEQPSGDQQLPAHRDTQAGEAEPISPPTTAPTLHNPCSPVMIEVPIRRCTHSPCALLAMSMRASTRPDAQEHGRQREPARGPPHPDQEGGHRQRGADDHPFRRPAGDGDPREEPGQQSTERPGRHRGPEGGVVEAEVGHDLGVARDQVGEGHPVDGEGRPDGVAGAADGIDHVRNPRSGLWWIGVVPVATDRE